MSNTCPNCEGRKLKKFLHQSGPREGFIDYVCIRKLDKKGRDQIDPKTKKKLGGCGYTRSELSPQFRKKIEAEKEARAKAIEDERKAHKEKVYQKEIAKARKEKAEKRRKELNKGLK